VRADGTFIAVEASDAVAGDTQAAAKLAEACPVDIFAQSKSGELELVEQNLDECVLCGLCLAAVPDGVKVLKLYDSEAELTSAATSGRP
jgi:NAD-dependent dihydropyrimidine dehydrogenase PreA subunit